METLLVATARAESREYIDMRNMTALRECARLGTAAALVGAVGCGLLPWRAPSPPPDVQPDMNAIVMVISNAYDKAGEDREVVFLDTIGVCAVLPETCDPPDGEVSAEFKDNLEATLQKKVLSLSEACFVDPSLPSLMPTDCETGEVGVSISIGRLGEDTDGYWHVDVTIALSSVDSTTLEYILERGEAAWTILVPAPDEGTLDARIRAADQAEVVEGHPDFGPTQSLLEEYAGDLDTSFYILDNMHTWRACRWRLAAAINPEHVGEICDQMVETLDDSVLADEVKACHNGERCLIY